MSEKSNGFPSALGGLVFLCAAVDAALWLCGVEFTPTLLITEAAVILILTGLLYLAFRDDSEAGGKSGRPRKAYSLKRRAPGLPEKPAGPKSR
jgi:hypothetical protein